MEINNPYKFLFAFELLNGRFLLASTSLSIFAKVWHSLVVKQILKRIERKPWLLGEDYFESNLQTKAGEPVYYMTERGLKRLRFKDVNAELVRRELVETFKDLAIIEQQIDVGGVICLRQFSKHLLN
jgi:hypothetical protein